MDHLICYTGLTDQVTSRKNFISCKENLTTFFFKQKCKFIKIMLPLIYIVVRYAEIKVVIPEFPTNQSVL